MSQSAVSVYVPKEQPAETIIEMLENAGINQSLDELPQLYNVLRGEMSLVGPRPPLPDEVAQYEAWQMRRLEVAPGITGMWQISGRSDLTFDEQCLLDIFYIENWSPILDIKILLRTVPKIVLGDGAY